jgi:uncharacterized protein YhaN
MRIEQIAIDGFGTWHDTRIEPNPGLTVVQGANEAGKTTLLAFVRSILFGFETGRHPALAGGRRGGWLLVATDDGRQFRIERYGERGGAGTLRVIGPDGVDRGAAHLDRLLHGVSASVYSNVFAFRLDELSEARGLTQGDVAARIYGAGLGTGAASAIGIENELREEAGALFKSGGQNPVINALLRDIARVDEELERLDPPGEYAGLRSELAQREVERGELTRKLEALAVEQRSLNRMINAWDPWVQLRHVEEQLAVEPEVGQVPSDALERLSRLDEAIRSARGAVEAAERRRARLDEQRAALSEDAALLDRQEEVRELARAAGEQRAQARSLAGARQAAGLAEQRVDEAIARLGVGWDEDRLAGLDISVAARSEATGRFRDLLDGAARAAERAELDRATAQDVLTAATAEHGDARSRLEDLASGGAAGGRAAEGEGAATSWSAPGAMRLAAGGVALAAVLGVLLSLLGTPLPPNLLAVGLLLVATGLAIWWLLRPAAIAPAGRPRLEAADERLRAADARRTAAERDLEGRSTTAERARVDVDEARAAWDAWLTSHGLPAGMDRETAVAVLDAAARAVDEVGRRAEARDTVARLEAEREAVAAAASTLLASLERPAMAKDDVLAAMERLGFELAAALEARRTAERLEREREDIADDAHAAGQRLEVATRERAELLATCGAQDADDLRQRAEHAARRAHLREQEAAARQALARLSGPGDALRQLLDEVAAVEQIGERRDRLNLLLAEIESIAHERDDCHEQIGALRHQLDDLATSQEATILRQRRADLVAQLEAHAERWSVLSLGVALLARTRERFEREHRPGVIRTAEGYLADWTGGRYRQIVAPLGGSIEGLERSDGTRVPLVGLSRGTQEQLYLALRFGLIEHFADEAEPLPILMDEILVNFDEDRAARAARTIEDLARRHQILYFTYREETPLRPGRVIRLAAPVLAAAS